MKILYSTLDFTRQPNSRLEEEEMHHLSYILDSPWFTLSWYIWHLWLLHFWTTIRTKNSIHKQLWWYLIKRWFLKGNPIVVWTYFYIGMQSSRWLFSNCDDIFQLNVAMSEKTVFIYKHIIYILKWKWIAWYQVVRNANLNYRLVVRKTEYYRSYIKTVVTY